MDKERKRSALGRQIEESVRKIQKMSYDAGYAAGLTATGDKLVRRTEPFSESADGLKQAALPEKGEKNAQTEECRKAASPVSASAQMPCAVYLFAPVLLSGSLCAAGILLHAPNVVTVLLSMAGAAVGVLLLEYGIRRIKPETGAVQAGCEQRPAQMQEHVCVVAQVHGKAASQPQIELPEMETTADHTVSADEIAQNEMKAEEAERYLQALLDYVASYEADLDAGYDVTKDRMFGEWVQNYLALCIRQNNPQMMRMAGELINRLESMKILVYADLKLNADGKPDVPYQDYLADARNGREYTQVIRPAVYTENGLLARGEVR